MDAAERTAPAAASPVTYDGFISYSHAADDLLAPRLQAGLQRFAKPWWKRRAVRIFRDESSLAANPHLWSSITEALEDSGWFVLLLSPDAAGSEWVGKEIEHWVANKPADRMLPVVTDGEFGWENGDVAGSSVPLALRGVFREEPRWVDLRFAKGDENLDLKNPTFSAAVADVASAIRGIPKDELESEEVRQHRRTVRTAWAAGIGLAVLAIVSVVASVFAVGQRNDARENAALAEENARIAQENADAEAVARQDADANAEEATRNAQLAQARELAGAAINTLDVDPQLSILLALASLAGEEDPPVESLVALREATHSTNLLNTIPIPGGEQVAYSALSPDGARFAVLSAETATVRVFDTSTWDEVWVYNDDATVDFPSELFFSVDGGTLAFSLVDSSSPGFPAVNRPDQPDDRPGRLVVLDALSGELKTEVEFAPCPGFILGPQSPDGSAWPVVTSDEANCEGPEGRWRLALLDSDTFEPSASFPLSSISVVTSWSDDSQRVVTNPFNGGVLVHDVTTGEVLAELPDHFHPALSPDGSLVASHGFSPSVQIHDLATGELMDRLTGLPAAPTSIRFSDDGNLVIAGSAGNATIMWDLTTGEPVQTMPATGQAPFLGGIAYDDESEILYHLGSNAISTWDLSGASVGEFNTVLHGAWAQANAMAANGVHGALLTVDDENGWLFRTFDARTGILGGASSPTSVGSPAAVLNDGRIVTLERSGNQFEGDFEMGPVVAWNPADGSVEEIVGCRANFADLMLVATAQFVGPCSDREGDWFALERFFLNPLGDRLLVTSAFGELLLYDPETLDPISEYQLDPAHGGVEAFGGDWVVVSNLRTPVTSSQNIEELTVLDIESHEVLGSFTGFKVELTHDGAALAVSDRPGNVSVYDTESWTVTRSVGTGDATIRGLSFSPDDSMLMTSGTDGFVRVWDLATGIELHRVPLEGASDGHWLDDQHIAVATSGGLWTTLTLDIDELIDLAMSRLKRDLTTDECEVYRIDPCPAEADEN